MAIPYAPSTPYQRNGTVADLIMQAGQQQAHAQMQKGNAWGRAIGDLGGIAAGAVQEYQAQKQKQAQADAISKRDQAFVQTLQQNGGKLDIVDAVRIYGPKDGPVIAKGLYDFQQAQGKTGSEAMAHFPGVAAAYLKLSPGLQKAFYESQLRPTAIAGGLFKEQDLPAQWSPEVNSGIMSLAGAFAPAEASPKTREVVVMNPDGTKTTRIVEDKPGQEFTSAAEPKKPDTRSLEIRLADALASGDTATAATIKAAIAQYSASSRAPKEDNEPLVPVMGDDGQPVLMRRSKAEGRKPASNREQGRPVTYGDAGRIAEIDNGILQAQQLKPELKTGTASKVGAMLPNPITDMTGFGSESKQQQAKIDLVKQIIGKALEGGVLRKEDEIKYAKILPSIGDADSVAQAKIDNLIQLLEQRKEIELSAREDAGYDVSKFRQRGGAAPAPAGNPLAVVAPDGKTYTFPNKAQADAFKKRAGIK